MAADDPIIPASDLQRVAHPRSLGVTVTRFGGHCGYYSGVGGPTWIEREILATLNAA
jgi:predicted alpha/beta-fold hydrolase